MIKDKLFSWQKKVLVNNLSRRSFGLFLDCGTGKTPLSLAFAEAHNSTRVLIITINPKALEKESVDDSWFGWVNKMYTHPSFALVDKKNKHIHPEREYECLLINYDSLYDRKTYKLKDVVKEFITSCELQKVTVILDEAHLVKNTSSLRSKAINDILRDLRLKATSVYLYLLTGTPFTVGYEDLYNELRLLGYKDSKTKFLDRFCIRGEIRGLLGWQQPIVGYKNIDELYDLVHEFAITIKSKDVVDLPEQVFVNHTYLETDAFKLFTREHPKKALVDKELARREVTSDLINPFYRNIDFPSTTFIADTISSFYLRSREVSIGFVGNSNEAYWYDHTRLNMLREFLTNYPDNYVIFYNFTPELVEIFDIVSDLGYKIDVYSGEIKSVENYLNYSKMGETERLSHIKQVIIANYASGSTGMNWQLYNKCILFSTPLFKDYEQGLKRIHRIGQKKVTEYHLFYQLNFIDRRMMASLKEQKDYDEKMFTSDLLNLKGEE